MGIIFTCVLCIYSDAVTYFEKVIKCQEIIIILGMILLLWPSSNYQIIKLRKTNDYRLKISENCSIWCNHYHIFLKYNL